ncbi:MAG: aspartate/glutamate racemase family protein [bacterium]|nr:aspartate/glutamate racemase family protein [bacterium]
MKTIGLLGGIGPHATMDFEQRIHRVSQRLIPPNANSGYPRLVVWYHRNPPFVMDEHNIPKLPLTIHPEIAHGARFLGQVADILIVMANGPHFILDQFENAAGKPFLSIIDSALAEVDRRGWKHVGVMGFRDPRVPVYTIPLEKRGIRTETLGDDQQALILDAVPHLMAGIETDADRMAVRNGAEQLRARGVDGMILGCTEFAFLYGEGTDAPDLINPAQLLAEAAVRKAIE